MPSIPPQPPGTRVRACLCRLWAVYLAAQASTRALYWHEVDFSPRVTIVSSG